MASIKYTYSIASDTANAKCDTTTLSRDIRHSSIVTALDYIDVNGDILDIWFKASLDTGDETALDTIVGDHDGEPINLDPLKNNEGAQIVDVGLRVGKPGTKSITFVTHDFSERQTWYQNSERETDVAMTENSGTEFQVAAGKRKWVNIHHDKITLDHNKIPMPDGTLKSHSDFEVIIKDTGSEVDSSNYTIDYDTGTVTFDSSRTGQTITATFSHNDEVDNPSDFIVAPPAGKLFRIEHIEIQFSKNVSFSAPLIMEGWAGGTLANYSDFNNTLYEAGYGQSRARYRGIRDLVNWCNNKYPVIPAPNQDGLTQDILVFPFHFLVALEIKSSLGTLIRVAIENHEEVTAEMATATFYIEMTGE